METVEASPAKAAVKLPSTSPANAACCPETLREVWGEALKDYITVSNL